MTDGDTNEKTVSFQKLLNVEQISDIGNTDCATAICVGLGHARNHDFDCAQGWQSCADRRFALRTTRKKTLCFGGLPHSRCDVTDGQVTQGSHIVKPNAKVAVRCSEVLCVWFVHANLSPVFV